MWQQFLVWLVVSVMSLSSWCATAIPTHTPHWTTVEKTFLANSGRQQTYTNEHIATIEVRNSYELGKLSALRFIEWAQRNPKGVVGFTSGNTPEFFVKFLNYYKKNWHKPEIQTELHNFGITSKNFPDTSNLRLVQIEEWYPVSDKNYKKISNYTKRHYARVLQIKPENMLLMDIAQRGILAEKGLNVVFMNGKVDLSITQHQANSQLEMWQQQAIKELNEFCGEYENKIRAWGGIGFLIAGIGYTGHLCFNEPGGKADSKTHFIKLDHRTAALAAKDFSDIDFARGKLAITIGLGTMAINPNAIILVIAAGESKAEVVRDSIERKNDVHYPGSLLQKFSNSRFYVTYGAAKLLSERRTDDVRFRSKRGWATKNVEEVILEIALAEKKPILSLKAADLNRYDRGKMLLANPPKPLDSMLQEVHNLLVKKIESGLKIGNTASKAQRILHTAPHHGDIVLGYYPLFDNLSYKNKNYVAYFTSGFNSVTDKYLLSTLNRASDWWLDKERDILFNKPYEKLITKFKTHFLKQDFEHMSMLETTMLMRHIISVYKIKNLDELKHTIRWLKDDYFPSKQVGDLDVDDIRAIKGMMRESEADRFWSLKNIPLQNITHLRSKFYSGREFMRTPRYESDIIPFINLYNKVLPDIITVVDDPQSDPAITNYRVLQIIAQGLRSNAAAYNPNLKILGYRNIWFRYSVFEANLFIPVPEHKLALQRKAFYSCFNTQKAALFPSPFYEGDFPTVSAAIQREQFAELKILLGEDYFAKSNIPELKTAVGFVFLMQMEMHYLFRRAEDLQQYIEIEDEYIAHKN